MNTKEKKLKRNAFNITNIGFDMKLREFNFNSNYLDFSEF